MKKIKEKKKIGNSEGKRTKVPLFSLDFSTLSITLMEDRKDS